MPYSLRHAQVCARKISSKDPNSKGAALRAMAHLLLMQTSPADLEKAYAKAVSAAKRWARKVHEEGCTTAAISASDRQNSNGRLGVRCGGIAINTAPSDKKRQCASCRLILLGHPLDTIAGRYTWDSCHHNSSLTAAKTTNNNTAVAWECELPHEFIVHIREMSTFTP